MPYAESSPTPARRSWRHSLLEPRVWKRAACYGFPAGLIQAVLNQGDHWMSGHVSALVALKTFLSPLVGFGVAYIAAATTHHETHRIPILEVKSESVTPSQHGLS